MSEDLVAKMKAAASSAIAEADAAAETAAPEPEATVEEPAADETPAVEAEEESVEADGETVEQEAETGEPEADEQPDYAEQVLAVRKQAEARVRKAENYARQLEEKLQYAAKYIEHSRKEVAEDIFKKLRRAPARTFKEFGFDFQELIDAGMREGSNDQSFGELDDVRKEIAELRREREEAAAERQAMLQQRQLSEARHEFLSQVKKTEFPALFNMFSDDTEALWEEAIRVAERHEERYGEAPEDIEVIRALEKKYAERVKRFGGTVASKAEAPAAKKPAAKTLSTKAASETRTAGKPFGQLSADEQKAALLAAVNATRQPNTRSN
jgi:hypothetical protein